MTMTRAPAGPETFVTARATTCRRVALPATVTIVGLLAACGGVSIKPQPTLPKPLILPIDADVGLVVPSDMRNYVYKETRWGVGWKIALGSGHTRLMQDVFKNSFRHVEEFKDLESARGAADIEAVFEPRIDQYSFVTARETGGRYYAVTIRYRINLYTPQGEKADSFTLTGYGNALAKGMSSGKPLERASIAAMRDAAAKFLVQFPDQPAGQQLARHEAITAEQVAAGGTGGGQIEAVAIDEPAPDTATPPPEAQPSTPLPTKPTASPAPASPAPVPDPAHDPAPSPKTRLQ